MDFGLYRMTKARVLTMDDMEKMENDNIIVLTDEDGTDVEFEFCASIEYEGNEYVVLLPTDVGVDDEDVLQKVFDIFKEQAGDEFDFDE